MEFAYMSHRDTRPVKFIDFEKPAEAVCRSTMLLPKGISEYPVGNRTHRTNGAAIGISLMWTLEGVPHVHQLLPKPLIEPFPKALQNSFRRGCDTRCDHRIT